MRNKESFLRIKNVSGLAVSPRSIMAVKEAKRDSASGILYLEVDTPGSVSTVSSETHVVTGEHVIPNNAFGRAYDTLGYNLYSYTSGTPVAGQNWGPVSGSSVLQSAGTGYKILKANSTYNTVTAYKSTGTGSSGTEMIWFDVIAASSAIGQGTVACDYVKGRVTHVSCNASSVQVGDEVNIYDPNYCMLYYPISLLTGISGVAAKMDNPFTEYDVVGEADCQYDLLTEGDCIWMVVSACCGEESAL